MESQYINISTYRPLSVSSYMDLPVELRSPRKGLINIENKNQKYFLWCLLDVLILRRIKNVRRFKNVQKEFKKLTIKIAQKLDYDGIEFSVQEKILTRLK